MPKFTHLELAGGGVVRRRFSMGGKHVRPGQVLTADEVIRMVNRHRLIGGRFIAVSPF